jgi:hypothetical protein
MSGWAGEVRGEILEREGGKVWVFGKRIGEMKGLGSGVSEGWREWKRRDVRVVELSHLCETVYHLVGSWPGKIRWVVFWSGVHIGWGVLDDEIAVFLFTPSAIIQNLSSPSQKAIKHTFGKQSRSKTKACNNCPHVNGKSNQLPHHQGRSFFPQIQPSSSARLYANSAARLKVYIAIVTLN